MKLILHLFAFICFSFSVFGEECSEVNCKAPKCQCFSQNPPFNHTKEDIPQFIVMTFDEAVRDETSDIYLGLSNYTNPNGCPIEATFFVSHVDTNYKLVNQLHRRGHEIAAHSITKNVLGEHWKRLPLEGWRDEFGGVKRIISKLAEIPESDIVGARAPQLQTAGNITFTALTEEGFKYDCSQPSRKNLKEPIFPYTLDFGFKADCQINPCLKEGENFPGFWSVPMNDWITRIPIGGNNFVDRPCASVDACIIYDSNGTWIQNPSTEDFLKVFEDNFKRFHESNRAPFPLFLRDAWLSYDVNRQTALIQFIRKMSENKNVYFVSISELIDWMGRGGEATKVGNYKQRKCVKNANHLPESKCGETDLHSNEGNCKYSKVKELNGLSKVVVVCNDVKCPLTYPWIKNN